MIGVTLLDPIRFPAVKRVLMLEYEAEKALI
jgi:hypothetical protein